MSTIRFPDPWRERYLAQIRANLRNARVPGGDVAAWLEPLPTACLAEALLAPRHRTAEVLFAALGLVRAANRPEPVQDLYAAARTNVPATYFAECAVIAWSTCRLAREHVEAGRGEDAQRLLIGITRWLKEWPAALVRRFEPRIEALYVQADALCQRALANEVAR